MRVARYSPLIILSAVVLALAFGTLRWWQGPKVQGYVMHALHPDGRHEYGLVRPEGLQPHDIGRMPDIYGQLQPAG